MILALQFLAKHESPFAAYMDLQRTLMQRYMSRGGTEDSWCTRIAPAFRRRYAPIFAAAARASRVSARAA